MRRSLSGVFKKLKKDINKDRRKLSAISAKRYKYLPLGKKDFLRTDNAALKSLLQFKNPKWQVARAEAIHINTDALIRNYYWVEDKQVTLCRTTVEDDVWQYESLLSSVGLIGVQI